MCSDKLNTSRLNVLGYIKAPVNKNVDIWYSPTKACLLTLASLPCLETLSLNPSAQHYVVASHRFKKLFKMRRNFKMGSLESNELLKSAYTASWCS